MTPGQARGAFLSFLLVTVGVIVNALFLQAVRIPAVGTPADRVQARPTADRNTKPVEAAPRRRASAAQPASEEQALRIARFAADPAKIDPAPAAPDEPPAAPETVLAIQRELKLRGYGPVATDGIVSLGTRAAIMAFEHDHHMPLRGEANEQLLKRILLGGSDASGSTGPADARPGVQAEQVIRAVQQWLSALGYQPGRVDGRLGEDTVKAIRDFEMDKGLVPKGRVSAELVARLGEAATRPAGR